MLKRTTLRIVTAAACAALFAGHAHAQAMAFSDIDANADGAMDGAELTATFGAAGASYLSDHDSDGDGEVDRDEAQAPSEADDQPSTFTEIDVDGDGVLEEAEIEHAFGPAAQAALAKFDANADGIVTLDEVRRSDDPREERRGVRAHSTSVSGTAEVQESRGGDRGGDSGDSGTSDSGTSDSGTNGGGGNGGNGGGGGNGGNGGGGNDGGGGGNGRG